MSDTPNQDSFEAKVNNLVSTVTRDDAGKLQFPEGTGEAERYAARTEIRRRDTQRSLQEATTATKRLEAENIALASSWEQDAIANLTNSQQADLEELKHSDPDAWLAKVTTLKEEGKAKFQARRTEITTNANKAGETYTREETMAAYEAKYPGLLTDDKLQNDIPPRLVKNLEEGKVDFDGFLQSCVDYLTKTKVIDKGTKAEETKDLSEQPGGGKPSEAAAKGSDSEEYKDTSW